MQMSPSLTMNPQGSCRIMGCAERLDGKVPDGKLLAIAAGMVDEGFCRCAAEGEEIGKRPLGCIDRDLQFPGQHVNAPDMVRMLVRDKQGFDVAGIDAGPFHPQEALFCAQAGINQQRTGPPSMTTQLPLLPLASMVQRIISTICHPRIRAFDRVPGP